ncbi:hypothetical protein Pmani_010512 [Petrolisthes manimaculis]|uniref:Uncharacterized protein n=1 Tax=Petrolisthes manimaculis TaxID=1843537 RepID=A0AAE1Q211_9EUCA|nr:hypothetical protein Pmani_010512 [Petrolisthes manimaculis]
MEHIVECWESVGVNNGQQLLSELGFTECGHERLSLRDLAVALEEECRVGSERDTPGQVEVTSVHLAALSYLHEVKFLRLSVECARGERDKLRQDLNEANQRLTLLAQELDEHSAQVEASSQLQIQELERQYREQVRELQEAAERDREAAREQVSTTANQALTQANLAHQEEARCKAKLTALSTDIKRLETENLELSEKLQESERQLSQMEKQVADIHTLKTKVAEYESMSPREEEYRRLVEQLECVIADNQRLRDSNDELLSQIDSLPPRINARNSDKDVSLDGSCLGDYVETGVGLEGGLGLTGVGLAGPVKRRGSNSGSGDDSCEEESPRCSKVRRCSRGLNVHYVDVGSYDESFFESSMSSLLKSSPVRSLRPLTTSQQASLDHQPLPPTLLTSTNTSLNSTNTSTHPTGWCEHVGGDDGDLLNKELKQCMKCKAAAAAAPAEQLTEALEELEAALSKEQQQHSITHTSLSSRSEEENTTKEEKAIGDDSVLIPTTTTLPDKAVVQALSHSTTGVNNDALLAENLSRRCRNLIDKIKRKRSGLVPKAVTTTTTDEKEEEEGGKGEDDNEEKERESVGVATEEEEEKNVITNTTTTTTTPNDDVGQNIEEGVPLKELEEQIMMLEEDLTQEKDGLEKQRANLVEKNNKLEHDLELLRVEFDKSEDYWSLKLQEEQDYYEEERRLYDDKFSALERKIREYEELVLAGGGGSGGSGGVGGGRDISEDSDRLSTIDESVVWEKQVTDLEEEVSALHKQVDQLREERFTMESSLEAKVSEERHLAAQECSGLQEQVNNLSSQLRQAQHQVTAVLEEMDKVRRESEQRIQELIGQQRQSTQARSVLVNGHMSEADEPTPMESQEQMSLGCGSLGEETIAGSLRSQLRQCQQRLTYLEKALRQHHTHASHILSVTRDQHAAEVQNLESMVVATQQMLAQHVAKYKDQLSKASRSDCLVKELYLENAQLMRALQITENRQKAAEDNNRKLQLAAALRTHTLSS